MLKGQLLELSFETEWLNALQEFAYPSLVEDRVQVVEDLKRMYGLTIKDESGEWSYIKQAQNFNTDAQLSQRKTGIGPDPDEVFLFRIGKLNKKFKRLLLQNFHQGGMFYTARQFLTFHINSLGFTPNVNQGHKHHIICEFGSEKLVVTEKFSVTKLGFLPVDMLQKVFAQAGELLSFDLDPSEKEKIVYIQNYIRTKLGENNRQKIGLRPIDQKAMPFVFGAEQGENLIEFTVKHTITLDPKSMEINIKKLSEEDVSFKIQSQFHDLHPKSSKLTFSKLLSLDFPCALPSFFEKSHRNKMNELILKAYRDFILILFNIIIHLISSPIVIPQKKTFLFSSVEVYEPQNSFPYRMRP